MSEVKGIKGIKGYVLGEERDEKVEREREGIR